MKVITMIGGTSVPAYLTLKTIEQRLETKPEVLVAVTKESEQRGHSFLKYLRNKGWQACLDEPLDAYNAGKVHSWLYQRLTAEDHIEISSGTQVMSIQGRRVAHQQKATWSYVDHRTDNLFGTRWAGNRVTPLTIEEIAAVHGYCLDSISGNSGCHHEVVDAVRGVACDERRDLVLVKSADNLRLPVVIRRSHRVYVIVAWCGNPENKRKKGRDVTAERMVRARAVFGSRGRLGIVWPRAGRGINGPGLQAAWGGGAAPRDEFFTGADLEDWGQRNTRSLDKFLEQ